MTMTGENSTDEEQSEVGEISRDDLDATSLLDLHEVDVGEEVWVPATMIRGESFRAVKVEVKERAATEDYDERHSVSGSWEGDNEYMERQRK